MVIPRTSTAVPLAVLLLLQAGCDLAIGLQKKYPPPPDAGGGEAPDAGDAGDAVDAAEEPPGPELSCMAGETIQLTSLPASSREVDADLQSESSGIGMAWSTGPSTSGGNLRFALVDIDGSFAVAPVEITATGESFAPAIASSGGGFALAWHEKSVEAGIDYSLRFAFVSTSGSVLVAGMPLVDSPDEGLAMYPSLAWSGSMFGVVWQDSRSGSNEVWFLAVRTTGNVAVSARLAGAVPGVSTMPVIAWNGSAYGVAWVNDSTGSPRVWFTLLNASGGRLAAADALVDDLAGSSENPGIAADSRGRFIVAWNNNSTGRQAVYAMLLGQDGAPLLPAPAPVSASAANARRPSVAPVAEPAPAGGGAVFDLCWEDDRDGNVEIYVASVGPDGARLSREGRITEQAGLSTTCVLVATSGGSRLLWVDKAEISSLKEDIFFTDFSCLQ